MGLLPEAKNERRTKFGMLADCDMDIDKDKRIVTITCDNPLPDDDVVIIKTSLEKVVSIMSEKVAGSLIGNFGKAKFFDGK